METGESTMNKLDVQARLEYARAAVAVLRSLKITDRTMRYSDFAAAIGLLSDGEVWKVWHRNQITDILNLVAATERKGRNAGIGALEYGRVVTGAGQPGPGFKKTSKIVTK